LWYYFSVKVRISAMLAKLTAKGQMTLPKAAREHLRVKAGDRVKIFNLPDGTTVLLPIRPVSQLRGIFKSPHRRPVTIEEMDEGIADAIVAELGIVLHPERARVKVPRGKARK
jgi:antitoxin PrlF